VQELRDPRVTTYSRNCRLPIDRPAKLAFAKQDSWRQQWPGQSSAMMDPTAWTAQGQSLPPAADDDFQQFLDIGGMSNLGDSMQFDFQDFGGSNGGSVIPRNAIDTSMSGTEDPTTSMGLQSQMTPITSGPGVPTVPSQMVSPHQNASDAIAEIEAQIQFLQHQKMQQQQRQLDDQQRRFEEQQAAFFAQQQQNMIPPTPHSLELPSNNQYYRQGGETGQHSQGMFDKYQSLREQQDVCSFRFQPTQRRH
jgi:hypothetical protein